VLAVDAVVATLLAVAPRRDRTLAEVRLIPNAMTIISPAYSTPPILTTAKRSPSYRRPASALMSAAEARTNPRLTHDFATPKPARARSIDIFLDA
jgi:hypothetical protein